MARGFGSGAFRGGSGSRGGSGGRRTGGGPSGSGSKSGSGARASSPTRGQGNHTGSSKATQGAKQGPGGQSKAKPRGQVRDGKVVQYSIKDQKGRTKYIGTTNNPNRRASEHRESGKLGRGDRLVVETNPIPRASAEKVENGKLNSHRVKYGRNPKHNTTNDGKFHQPRLF